MDDDDDETVAPKWRCLQLKSTRRHHRHEAVPARDGNNQKLEKVEQELAQIPSDATAELRSSNNESAAQESHMESPNHLLIMVNGIVGSANDWKYTAVQFKLKQGDKVIVHCSSCNSATLTFHGVNIMGRRLADEVRDVVNRTPGLAKISFLAHSLGGLVARYAISQLYVPVLSGKTEKDREKFKTNEVDAVQRKGTLLGLQPINFITIATPHLGSRGNKQLPFLCGIVCLEKVAPRVAHLIIGKTGKHLFLADGSCNKLPLLQRMTTDCEEGLFISALQGFKHRVAYANICNDHMVGWRTSSLRRKSEIHKMKHVPLDPKYPHIINVEDVPSQLDASTEFCLTSPVAELNEKHIVSKSIEEKLLVGLTQLKWKRVDVSFRGSCQRFFAHSTIQVKIYCLHSDGADVIAHIIDNFEV
ncbi:hypothetical protein O6H91_10G090000 [Diphasiastrum complanatum]|uniref:Uncharacterized protein n=1 Tax=Diphasiastrum complanatum TaxID=34168 RepID=A0ACC2CJD8_DIPCM|nr:hypothetical protein O6H91_10G090000 [Diphasiastrum complanatum]